MGILILCVVSLFLIASSSLQAQMPTGNSEVNAEGTDIPKRDSGAWREMFENKPDMPMNFKERVEPQGRQQELDKIEEKEKKLPSPLWGDARSRREARRARGEKIKEQEDAISEGRPVDPKDKVPPVVGNARSRRGARADKYELQQEKEEVQRKSVRDKGWK